jgi:hypothetical protein
MPSPVGEIHFGIPAKPWASPFATTRLESKKGGNGNEKDGNEIQCSMNLIIKRELANLGRMC